MVKQTRRNFLGSLLGTTALAVIGPTLNSCAGWGTAIKTRYQRKYNTTAHDFLDIESPELGVEDTDYQVLDDLIIEAKQRIPIQKKYTKDDAIDVLRTIDDILGEEGFEYESSILFNPGLKNKKIDCDNYVAIYLSIAEVLGLPLNATYAPYHVFVRWHFNSKDYFNWEATKGTVMTNKEYRQNIGISDVSIKNGVFLKSLTASEFCAIAYENRGIYLYNHKEYKQAILNFNQGIKLCPTMTRLYADKGDTFFSLKDYRRAIELYNKVIELDPKDHIILNHLKIARERLKEQTKS